MMTRGPICGVLLAATLAAGACESSTSRGSGWSWFGAGRISRAIVTGTTSAIEEGKVVARTGQTIEVTYEVTVREGAVQIDVWRPLTVWGGPKRLDSVTIAATRQGTLTVAVEEHLTYEIRTRPIRFAGSYDVSWKVR
jgi:hypothetical protein